MAIDRTGIDSLDLDAGATKSPSGSSIKFEGDIVEHDETTTINFIAYSKIIAPLVLAVQELSTELEEQKEEIAELYGFR